MYSEDQIVAIAARENNTKRNYLVVNRLQGKHVPVSPERALEMFAALAESLKSEYRGEKLLVVGFAETATAIGAAVAIALDAIYIHTTREKIPGAEYLQFSESHSHATEQKLVKDDIARAIHETDRIVFVEDELTTGNTILKIVDIIEREYPGEAAFSVASLLNGMDEEARGVYRERNIPLHYLVKTDHASYPQIAEKYRGDGRYVAADMRNTGNLPEELRLPGWVNARRCAAARGYLNACAEFWKALASCPEADFTDKRRILVLGTEEFMYPAMYIAARIEKMGGGRYVRFHATTRSPIAVSTEEEYPLHTRYELRSLYENERKTFIYDLERYDMALIITDAQDEAGEGISMLANALGSCGNEKILLVRWCSDEKLL